MDIKQLNDMLPKEEELAKLLHKWYLEACKKLKPESYNPNAQKSYEDMTEEQKFLDRYIADKCLKEVKEIMSDIVDKIRKDILTDELAKSPARLVKMLMEDEIMGIEKKIREEILKELTEKLDLDNMLEGYEKHWIDVGNGRYIEHCIECENSKRIKELLNK